MYKKLNLIELDQTNHKIISSKEALKDIETCNWFETYTKCNECDIKDNCIMTYPDCKGCSIYSNLKNLLRNIPEPTKEQVNLFIESNQIKISCPKCSHKHDYTDFLSFPNGINPIDLSFCCCKCKHKWFENFIKKEN